jgi:hypothetical protein
MKDLKYEKDFVLVLQSTINILLQPFLRITKILKLIKPLPPLCYRKFLIQASILHRIISFHSTSSN